MKNKKLFLIVAFALFMFLGTALIVGAGGTAAFGDTVAGTVYFNGGSGTVEDPYQIATPEQLDAVRNYLDQHFVLTADISLENYDNWEPIGAFRPLSDAPEHVETPDPEAAFSGTFNGDGHTISNVIINQPAGVIVGLFGCMAGTQESPSSIHDLTVENVDVTGFYLVGGVVGLQFGILENVSLTGDNTVRGNQGIGGITGVSFVDMINCRAEADIVVLGDDGAGAGVLVGGMEGCSIIDCWAIGGTVRADGNDCWGLGGLAGNIFQGIAATNCHVANVSITASGANTRMVGGLLGFTGTYDDDPPTQVTGCSADTTITVSDSTTRVGGLIGGSYDDEPEWPVSTKYTIANCSTAGSITGGSEAIGSIAGYAYNSTVENCTSTMTINGDSNPPQVGWRAVAQTVTEGDKELEITEGTAEEVNLTVPAGVTGATVNVAALLGASPDGGVSATLPKLNIQATTSISSDPIEVSIPAGTVVNAPEGWDGTINMPTVRSTDSVTVTPDSGKRATVNTVIEIGFGDVPLTFDRAVRILIPGQASKDAGYSRAGVFTKITKIMEADSQAAGDALPAGGDGKINAGDDLAIWTKHFTRFVTYTQTSRSSGGGGGSSTVSSTSGMSTITPGTGGTVSLGNEASVVIPAGTLQGTDPVEVKIQKVSQPPQAPAGFKLAGAVYAFSVGGADSYSFAKKVTLKISFDPSWVSDGTTPTLQYYDQTEGEWVEIGGSVSGNFVTASVDHFTQFAVMTAVQEAEEEKTQPSAVPAEAFNDIAGHWAFNNINKLVSLGAIAGYPDGSFRPDSSITRAEFATVLAKAFKLAPQGGKRFTDTADHWARDYIAAVVANGIAGGYDDNLFGPDDLITREQMAVMIGKAAGLSPAAVETSFADRGSISTWAREALAAVVEKGLMAGYPDNTFRPQANATRAEAVTIIGQALN